jgi:DNA-binding MarR family transcriptional regulator
MEADGLVRRSADEHDRRVVWISATARGKRRLREGRERRIAMLSHALHGVSPDDLRMLDKAADLMAGISRSVEQRP